MHRLFTTHDQSVVLVAVAALVASDWPPGWCYAIPAAAVIVCVLGKRKSSGNLPGSAPVLVLQAIMLVLYYSNLVTRSAALLPLPALLVYSVAAWAYARRVIGYWLLARKSDQKR